MPDVIDLTAQRDRRNGPDPQFVTTDPFGRPMFAFSFSYEMDGGTFLVAVFAYDFDDAERRCAAIRETLVLTGQIHSEVEG